MQKEYRIVIADTTCFILLEKIGEINLLKDLFSEVVTTRVISDEFGPGLPDWIEIKEVSDTQIQLSLDVDKGEASAIALALEYGPSLLIMDDNKGRKAARRLRLEVTGTLGLILKAKRANIIPAVKPLIEKISKTNFWYSDSIIAEILYLADEG